MKSKICLKSKYNIIQIISNREKAQKQAEEESKAAELLTKQEHTKEIQAKEKQNQIDQFITKLKTAQDPIELVKDLCEFLKKSINATDAYLGMIEQQQKEAKDEDDENAHLDTAAPTVLRYVYDTSAEKIMIGKLLRNDEGVVFEILQKKRGRKERGK